MDRRAARGGLAALLLLVLAVAILPATGDNSEVVSFNTNTLKYHCVTCEWARKCTVNCVSVTRSDAIAKGGVACKVCRGQCRK